ncbi:MAG: hypothetical protein NT035_03640 [Burkholderiales bacterium]|nr:hypothetical protein [Burkholderiales bacterium]
MLRRVGPAFVVGGSFVLALAGAWAQTPMAGVAAPAPQLTAQDRLDAIRQSLVDAALHSPTRVYTTSWIDGNGSLRESSSFKTGMQVRGVRVLAYDRDDTGQARARLQLAPPPEPQAAAQTPWQKLSKYLSMTSLWGSDHNKQLLSDPHKDSPQKCSAYAQPGAGLRHLISLEQFVAGDTHPALADVFYQLSDDLLLNPAPQGTPSPWRMLAAQSTASMSASMGSYERALTGSKPEVLPWQARLAVKTDMLPAPGLAGLRGEKGPDMNVSLVLQVSPQDGQKAAYQEVATLVLSLDIDTWKQARLSQVSQLALKAQLQQWRQSLSQWMACEPLTPMVTAVQQEQVQINAGSLAGVRKGDEWVIADPARFPAQILARDGAPQTLLAKVQSVGPHDSQLLVLAGPVQAVQAHWRAWPAETLAQEPPILPASKPRSPKQ